MEEVLWSLREMLGLIDIDLDAMDNFDLRG
jgi:hypothetical protein